jgi:hypothetical protein
MTSINYLTKVITLPSISKQTIRIWSEHYTNITTSDNYSDKGSFVEFNYNYIAKKYIYFSQSNVRSNSFEGVLYFDPKCSIKKLKWIFILKAIEIINEQDNPVLVRFSLPDCMNVTIIPKKIFKIENKNDFITLGLTDGECLLRIYEIFLINSIMNSAPNTNNTNVSIMVDEVADQYNKVFMSCYRQGIDCENNDEFIEIRKKIMKLISLYDYDQTNNELDIASSKMEKIQKKFVTSSAISEHRQINTLSNNMRNLTFDFMFL